MPDVAFVLPRVPTRLRGLAAAVRAELERQGMVTSEHDRFPEPGTGRIYVLVDPGGFLDAHGVDRLPSRAVLHQTLMLTAQGSADAPDAPRSLLDLAGRVFDVSQGAVSAMHVDGIPARLLRPGYCPEWDRFDAGARREIDIAVIDVHTARRSQLLSDAADVLSRHPASIRLIDGEAVDPDERRTLFRRSKVALLLHPASDARFDRLSAVEAMHCGAVVVTEHATEVVPFEMGRHLFGGSSASLPWIAEQLLHDRARLARARVDAYERLRDWMPFSVSVGVMRAALVEMLGCPLDEDPADDLNELLGGEVGADPEGSLVMTQFRRTHQDLAEVRRRLDHLQATMTVDQGDQVPATVETNRAWDADARAAVCVLFTIGGDEAAAITTLASLGQDRSPDFELIVAWTGSPLPRVLKWLATRLEVPVAQVHGLGGLAATRNAALALVRAPSCLLLDSGVWVFPRCREVLTRALLEDPTWGFAYPILAMPPQPGEGGNTGSDRLIGLHEWTREADLGSPVMARTELLRSAGGFMSQSPQEGVERDEIWSRLPARGRQVPEILSRR